MSNAASKRKKSSMPRFAHDRAPRRLRERGPWQESHVALRANTTQKRSAADTNRPAISMTRPIASADRSPLNTQFILPCRAAKCRHGRQSRDLETGDLSYASDLTTDG